jgi:hypothetical protein
MRDEQIVPLPYRPRKTCSLLLGRMAGGPAACKRSADRGGDDRLLYAGAAAEHVSTAAWITRPGKGKEVAPHSLSRPRPPRRGVTPVATIWLPRHRLPSVRDRPEPFWVPCAIGSDRCPVHGQPTLRQRSTRRNAGGQSQLSPVQASASNRSPPARVSRLPAIDRLQHPGRIVLR